MADHTTQGKAGQTLRGIRYNPIMMPPLESFDPVRTVYYPGTERIRTGYAVEPVEVQSVRFPKGSILGFTEAGLIWRCYLGEDTEILGIPCRGRTEVEFHPNGQLASCVLRAGITVSGCALGEGTFALFHPTGALFCGTLGTDLVRDTFVLLAGTEVCLFEDGCLSSFQAGHEGALIEGISLSPHSRVWLHRDGRLKAGSLESAWNGGRLACPGGSMAWFHPDGVLSGCTGDTGTRIFDTKGKRRPFPG